MVMMMFNDVQERRICMTIPQQECAETVVEKCDLVPRQNIFIF